MSLGQGKCSAAMEQTNFSKPIVNSYSCLTANSDVDEPRAVPIVHLLISAIVLFGKE